MVFIDSNILIYAYSETEVEKKNKVLSILESEDVSLNTQVINEFIWIMNRKFDVDLDSLKLISNNIFQLFDVILVTETTINKAIDLSQKLKYSYWDSLILASALEKKCNTLYTEDMQHGQIIEDNLKIVNPFI